MSMVQEIRIPDIGDVEQVEVIEICAAVGEQVGSDDALIVIESDKASMEVPAGITGTLDAIAVKVGDQVGEGDLIARITQAGSAAGEEMAGQENAVAAAESAAQSPAEPGTAPAPEKSGANDHGSGDHQDRAPAAGVESTFEVRVPDIGDAKDVVVIELNVTVGDVVDADDLLVVVESDKASMEIPAGQAGTVKALHVDVDSAVEEGTLLATLTTIEMSAPDAAAGVAADSEDTAVSGIAQAAAGQLDDSAQLPPLSAGQAAVAGGGRSATSDATPAGAVTTAPVYAGPAVRRLARELGVDLGHVSGTGNRGRIVKDDVKSFVKSELGQRGAATPGTGIPPLPDVDFSKFGPIEMLPMSRIRAAGAVNLHRSWLNIPHVTQHEEADVTELEAFRKTLKDEATRRDTKITPLAFIVKACCYALEAFPTFNASLDLDGKNFILKKYYHVGFAVDTPDGLVVPVIRDADTLGIWDLSAAIAELAGKARDQKLALGDMMGGTFSVSSLGAIGGTGFTPIINAPEVAILGVSRLAVKPVWDGDAFVPRHMMPLSLSYDHRAVNGAEAGRFLALLAELLGDIRRLSL